MSKFNRKGLVFALENNEELPNEEVTSEELIGSQSDADEAMGDVDDTTSEIDDMHEAMEEAEADLETLGKIKDTMEDSLEGESAGEEGEGMSETAAEIAEVAVEAICAKLGIVSHSRILPSLESFGSTNTRREATKRSVIALEGAIDTVKENLIKAAKWIWEKIQHFFATLLQNVDKLEKNAKTLFDTVSKEREGTKEFKEQTLTSGLLSGVFGAGGKVDRDMAVTIAQFSAEMVEAATQAPSLLSSAVAAVNAAKDEDAVKKGVFDKISAVFAKLKDKVLPGNKTVEVTPEGEVGVDKKEAKKEVKIIPLDSRQIIAVLQENIKLINKLKGLKESAKKMSDVKKEIISAIETSVKENGPVQPAILDAEIKKITKAGQVITTEITKISFQVAYAINKYAALSYANLVPKKAETK